MRLIRRVSCNKLRAEGAGQNVGQEGRGDRKQKGQGNSAKLLRKSRTGFLLAFFLSTRLVLDVSFSFSVFVLFCFWGCAG